MKKTILSIALGALVAGCDTPEPVTAFNGYSVNIQAALLDNNPQHAQEAQRLCGKVGKRAEHASTTPIRDTLLENHLYLCL